MIRLRAALVAAAALSAPRTAAAHPALPATPHTLWTEWSFEPAVLIGLGLVAALWARGVTTTWRAAGAGRVFSAGDVRAAAVALGVLAVALITPLDALAEALFAGHMTQHLLLLVVAAPLLVRGDVMGALFRGLPAPVRRLLAGAAHATPMASTWRHLRAPLPAWLLHAAVLWAWHLPRPYEGALHSGFLHVLEHATMLGTAVLFWLPVLDRSARTRLVGGTAILYLFTFGMQASLLGALLTVAERPWYDGHMPWAATWGLTARDDQRLAGTILWVPGGAAYLLAVARVLVAWAAGLDGRAPATAAEGAR